MNLIDRKWLDSASRGSGWRLILSIMRRYRLRVSLILLATIGVYASSLAVPILTQQIVDGIVSRRTSSIVLGFGLVALAFAIVDVYLADIRRSMVIELSQDVDQHISLAIMKHVLGARIDVEKHDTGAILNRTEQTDKIKQFLVDIIPSSIFDIGGAVIAAMVIFAYSLYCGLAALAITIAGFFVSKLVLHSLYESASLQFRLNSEKQGNLAETANGLPTIKALAIEPGRLRSWMSRVKASVAAARTTEHILRRFVRVTRLTQHLLMLAVVGVGGLEMMHGSLTVGELLAVLLLAGKVSAPLINASDIARQIQEVAVAVRELGSLLDAPQDRADAAVPIRTPPSGEIAFRDVSYRYDRRTHPAVAGLDLRLPNTGLIAVIGRNGSGKSTALRLLQGLLRDFQGEITVGGVDVRSYHPRLYRSRMAVVNQDTVLFAGTVRENVTCWEEGFTDAEIEKALRLVGAWDFVDELPDRVDARLIENGANLSGGQRQRLSIARAVLRDPRIILLDEPTAFLDAEAAVGLERRLGAWAEARLMILVTHHLTAVRAADRIILMDRGKVAAQGRHDDLMESSPLYRSLWDDYLRGADISLASPATGDPAM